MNKREIFFIVSLAFLGIFILFGSYLWKENAVYSQETEYNKGTYANQAAEPQKKTIDSQANSTNASSNTTNPTAAVASTVATPPVNVQTQQSNPAPPTVIQNNSYITTGSKVGDIVKLGDIEMIVTKASERHKVIDITLKGNTPEQPPRLILAENNRIVYEIPADVDINMDVTEKTTIEKSPFFYGEQKAGK